MKDKYEYIDWEIISRSVKGGLLKGEQEQLTRWLEASPDHLAFYEKACTEIGKYAEEGLSSEVLDEKRKLLLDKAGRQRRLKQHAVRRIAWIKYAAVVLLAAGLALIGWFLQQEEKDTVQVAGPVVPGHTKAILELSDGRTYILDTNKMIETGLSGQKLQTKQNLLIYEKNISTELVFNKLTVPRGGVYELRLSDGSRVWLNSNTELRYPVAFNEKERILCLSGEAYFQVERDSLRPFIVMVDDMQVKVYGTEFNINTHDPRMIRTVLVNGKVGIRSLNTGQEVFLLPDQLAEYNVSTRQIAVSPIDPYPFIAWKNGEFVFENETIESIMNRLAEWYDLKVFFNNEAVKKQCFTGIISRFGSVSEVLHLIESTATVQFEIRDHTIIVK